MSDMLDFVDTIWYTVYNLKNERTYENERKGTSPKS